MYGLGVNHPATRGHFCRFLEKEVILALLLAVLCAEALILLTSTPEISF